MKERSTAGASPSAENTQDLPPPVRWLSLFTILFRFPLLKHYHHYGQPGRSHSFSSPDLFQCVLIDSPAHQFPLGNIVDPR
jgi:hypothetical protein